MNNVKPIDWLQGINLKMLKNLLEYLKKDKIQRLIYGIGLVLWIYIWHVDLKNISENNPYGIYLWPILIPIPLLIGQIIFNNKIVWIILVTYATLFSLGIIWNIIELDILIDIQRDFSPQPFWAFEKVKDWLIMVVILFATNWIIWRINPIKTEKRKLN